ICHAAEHSVNCFLRIGFGQVGIGCYRIYEFGLVHKDESPAGGIVCEYTNGQNRRKVTLSCKPTTTKPWYAVADNCDGAVSATLYQGPRWRVNKGSAVTADMHELRPFASACFQCARTPPVAGFSTVPRPGAGWTSGSGNATNAVSKTSSIRRTGLI